MPTTSTADGVGVRTRIKQQLLAAYQWPVIATAVTFMLWVRLRSWRSFLTPDGTLYRGADAWYHLRNVRYTVKHYPQTLGHDALTNYPHGAAPGQFGTLYDQAVATAALIVGAGNPSSQTVELVLLVAPAILGAAVALPVYVLTRRVADRFAGSVAVAVLALLPGTFLTRTLVGASDHNAAEPLLFTACILALAVAHAPRRNQAKTAAWSVFAGAVVTVYLYTWPPAVLLIGVYGLFVLVQLSNDVLEGRDPFQTTLAPFFSMGTLAFFAVLRMQALTWDVSSYSLLQPVAALTVSFGAVGAGFLAVAFRNRGHHPVFYPLTLTACAGATLTAGYPVKPDAIGAIVRNVRRFVLFGSSPNAGIAEALPYTTIADHFGVHPLVLAFFEYGAVWVVALLVVAIVGYQTVTVQRSRQRWAFKTDPQMRLVATSALVLAAAGLTQIRFQYYLAPFVAVLAGGAATQARALAISHLPASTPDTAVSADAIFATGLALAVILVPLAAPVVATGTHGQTMSPISVSVGGDNAPSADVQAWHSHLQWLRSHTPVPALNASGVPYYGVLSWWDAGHWITTVGQRPAVANPMQQHSDLAARVLLAPSEEKALEALHGGPQSARYVVLDHQVLDPGAELPSVLRSVNRNPNDYFRKVTGSGSADLSGLPAAYETTRRYEKAFGVRLFNHHGSRTGDIEALEHYRLVATSKKRAPDGGAWVKTFEHVPGATLEGEAAPNQTVTATVTLETRWGQTFTYQQRTQANASGHYSMTVPYATTGYDDVKGTDVAVQAIGPYKLTIGSERILVSVPERAVQYGNAVNVSGE